MDEEQTFRAIELLCDKVEAWSNAAQREPIPRVQVGSRTAGDDALTAPYHLSHAMQMYLGAGLDHLQALRALLVDAGAMHMSAPFTLLRATIENASHALWLITPDDELTRVRRRLQLAVADARERDQAGLLLGEVRAPDKDLASTLERLAGLAQASGVPTGDVLGKAPSVGTIVSAADAADDALPLQFLWRLGSGTPTARPGPCSRRLAGSDEPGR